MNNKVLRFFLEIKSIKELKYSICKEKNLLIREEISLKKTALSSFLYREIGRDFFWKDRLIWTEDEWEKITSNDNYQLFILQKSNEIVGYFELISDKDKDFEISYFGIFKEYFGKKIGGYLLSNAIQIAFNQSAKRVWVHTCTLDHPNALKNYIARGMKIFKSEELNIN